MAIKMFDYSGDTSETLEALCCKKNVRKNTIKPKYGICENYSLGYFYRDYAQYPNLLPLYTYSEHGIEFDIVGKHEIENDAYAMFVFSDKKLENFRKVSNKPCYKVMHPFAWYRQQHIVQGQEAKGTIAFPSHSTADITCEFDIDKYIAELNALPSEMQPVCVCLHMSDIKKKQHLEFIKRGIPVYTTGHIGDSRFGERFYNILKHFKYSTSNFIGSYAYYSVEMGIPFSLYGQKSKHINISDSNLEKGIRDYETNGYNIAKNLFSGIHSSITNEQYKHVKECLGIDSGLSRKEMRKIFYKAFFKKGLSPKQLYKLIKSLLKFILLKIK